MSDHNFIDKSRKQWSSESAFIVSMAAAAVGLGNLWRFPYIVGENGGGVFVVAYLLALFIVVLPIMMLEVASGRLTQGNTVATFKQVNQWGRYYGWFVVILTSAITSYYLVITGWTLGYSVDATLGELKVFDEFTKGFNSFCCTRTNRLKTLLVCNNRICNNCKNRCPHRPLSRPVNWFAVLG